MGKTTTSEFDAKHQALQGNPLQFVRFYALVGSGPSASEAPFTSDFSTYRPAADAIPPILAAPNASIWKVGVTNDGILQTTLSPGPVVGTVFLLAPNAGTWELRVTNDGLLQTVLMGSNGLSRLLVASPDLGVWELRVTNDGILQTQKQMQLDYLTEISGNTQTVQPEQGASSIGQFVLTLLDVGDEITRYCADPARKLGVAMTASVPANGGNIEAKAGEDIAGYPEPGTVVIGTERCRYVTKNVASRLFQNITRAMDGTVAAAHAVDDLLHNGEQIRPGIRAQVFVGYEGLAEADFLALHKMQVYERDLTPDGLAYQVVIADIQRSTKRRILGSATEKKPIILYGNKVHLALKMLLTSSEGGNSKYDRGDGEGLGIAQALVDVAGLEALAVGFGVQKYRMVESGPQDGKAWLEALWKSLNCYPFILPDGKYSAIRYAPAPAPASQPLLDDSNTVGMPKWKPGDRLIVNVVEMWYDWDHVAGKFMTRQVYEEAGSISKYGRQPPLVIEDRGLASDLGAQAIADDRANRVFGRYADPPPVLEMAGFWDHLVRDVGDIVRVTSPRVPNLRTGLRGLTTEVMEITDLTPVFPLDERAVAHVRITLLHTGAVMAPAAATGVVSAPVAIPSPTRYLVEAIPVRNDGLKAKYAGLTSLWTRGYETNDGVATGAATTGKWRREAFSHKIDPSSGPDVTL